MQNLQTGLFRAVVRLSIVALASPALGQSFSIVSADGGRPPFKSNDTVRLEMWFQDFGLLNEWQVHLDLGDSLELAPGPLVSIGEFAGGFSAVRYNPSLGILAWSAAPPGLPGGPKEIGTDPFMGFTFDVEIAAGHALNSFFGVLLDDDTFFRNPDGEEIPGVTFAGLAAGGSLVPEPSSLVLLLNVLASVLLVHRRCRRPKTRVGFAV